MTFAKTLIQKTAFAPAIALAAMVPLAGAAQAGEADEQIVVTSQAAMEQWQANATRTLNSSLARPANARSASTGAGIVQVRFDMGVDGRPANIEIAHSSANRVAEHNARRAVRRLGDISDVPVTNADNAQFLANIIFAKTPEQRDELAIELQKAMAEGFAVEGENLILLGG
ncbi:MAG: hypothetical protein AAF697_03750 [Pseudomonadota bacterium]